MNVSKKSCFRTIKHVPLHFFLKFNNTKLILTYHIHMGFFVETDSSGDIPANAFLDTKWWEVSVRRSTLV